MSATPIRISAGLGARAALGGVALLVAVFLVFPVAVILPISFSGSAFLRFPPEELSLRWYAELLARPAWRDAAWLSLWVAALSTLIATVLGTAAALAVMRARFWGRSLLVAFLLSPLVVPGIIVAIAVYFFYAPLGLVGSPIGMAIAHAALASPFVLVNVCAALSGVDRRLEMAALNLGASDFGAFRHITFPLIRPGMAAGAVFAFIASFDEMIVAMFITSPGNVTLPIRMWESMRNELSPAIAAASSLIILLSIALFLVAGALRRRAERRSAPGARA